MFSFTVLIIYLNLNHSLYKKNKPYITKKQQSQIKYHIGNIEQY